MRSRFKGLDLTDRVLEEIWTEVHNIVQEVVIKTIPKKKKFKRAKWLSEGALQIAVKRREVKSKREKERYKHLNAEFQRIARRDKKAFLRDQCKVIEENNRMGKTRDLEESEKVGLKLNIQKTKIMTSNPITSRQIDGETVETVSDFIFGGAPKSLQMVIAAIKLKDTYSLEGKL